MGSVLIIGGGIIGLMLAREFHKRGTEKIKVLDRGEIGKEASFAAAGMLSPQAEADRADDFFRFCSDSKDLYSALARDLFQETGIDIELDQTGTLYLGFNASDSREIRERFDWQSAAGLEVQHLNATETHQLEPIVSPGSIESLFFPNDWQVENRKLIGALRKYAEISGIEIVEHANIENLVNNGKQIESAVTAEGSEFAADTFIVASGAWSSLLALNETNFPIPKVKPIRGQMVSFHTAKRLFDHVIYSPRGYIVPRRDGTILAGATVEDVGFDDETTTEGIEVLVKNTQEISPGIANLAVGEKWSGLRPLASDGLPIIGSVSDTGNLFVATAHYRNGILLAPMTARILADKIVDGVDSDLMKIWSPNRLSSAKMS